MTVDTACSSSLVALHLAAQALRSGECSSGAGRWCDGDVDAGRRSSSSPGSGGWRRTGGASRSRTRRTAPGWSEGVGVLVVERLSDAAAQRASGAGGGAGHGGESGRCVERADRAERSVAAAGDPAGAGERRACRRPMWTWWRRTARARRWVIRSRRRRCWPPTARTGIGPSAVAGVGEVEHRAHAGRGGCGGCDQDGAWRCGTACCRGPCTWTRRRRMWTGRRARCELLTEADGVAGDGSAAAGGGVVVRDQRHQRPRDPRAGAVAGGAGRRTAAAAPGVGAVGGVGASPRPRCGRRRRGSAALRDGRRAAAGRRRRSRWRRRGRRSSTGRSSWPRPDGCWPGRGGRRSGCGRRVARPGRTALLFTGQGVAAGGDGSGVVRPVPGVRGGVRRGVRAASMPVLREVMWGEDAEAAGRDGVRAAGVVRGRGGAVPAGRVVGCAPGLSWLGIRSVRSRPRMWRGCCRWRMRARWWRRGAG